MANRQPNDAGPPAGWEADARPREADAGPGQPDGAPAPEADAADPEERVTERLGRLVGAGPAGERADDRTAEISGRDQAGERPAPGDWVAAADPEPAGRPGTGREAGPSSGAPQWWSSSSRSGTAVQPQPGWGGAPSSPPSGPSWGDGPQSRPGLGDGPPSGPSWSGGAPSPPSSSPGWGDGPPSGPSWDTAPVAGTAPPGRGRSLGRTLLAVVAAIGLLLTGAGLNRLADRQEQPVAGSGVPVAAAPAAPLPAGQEPVAAVARTLGPSVVQLETGDGLGSGVIYDKNGFILTAAHVTEGAQSVTVRLFDGTALRGRVLGSDEGNDIAVVKVDRTDLRPASLALRSDLQVGQMAVAIGSPFGLEQTVTVGVVSAKQRSLRIPDGGVLEVIQTDAPINPGNSGGALADRQGRVIGINDSIRSESGGNEGVGFAVPIDTAANSAARIVKGEPIQTGYLGVSLDTPSLGRAGALVSQVEQGSPAAQSGLRVGDLIVQFGSKSVQSGDDLGAQVRLITPGQRIPVKVVRDGNEQTITVSVGERPRSAG